MTLLCTACTSTGRRRSVRLWFWSLSPSGEGMKSRRAQPHIPPWSKSTCCQPRTPRAWWGRSLLRPGYPTPLCGASSMRVAVTCLVHPLSRASGHVSAWGLRDCVSCRPCGRQEGHRSRRWPSPPLSPLLSLLQPHIYALPFLFCLRVLFLVNVQWFRRGIPRLMAEVGGGYLSVLGLAHYHRLPHFPPPPTHFSFARLKVGWQHVSGIHSLRRLLRKGTRGKQKNKEACS